MRKMGKCDLGEEKKKVSKSLPFETISINIQII